VIVFSFSSRQLLSAANVALTTANSIGVMGKQYCAAVASDSWKSPYPRNRDGSSKGRCPWPKQTPTCLTTSILNHQPDPNQSPISPALAVLLSKNHRLRPPLPGPPVLARSTLELAAHDVRQVLREQSNQGHTLTTKLNILFVTNGALLTSLSISRLIISGSIFSVAEALGFLAGFSLLMRAFLPRQVAITPNLEERKFLETYLALSYEEYQLQMMVNLAETYRANKQRLDDVSQTLRYAAYATWSTAVIMLVHIVAVYLGI